ncbi:MAG: hypothetical protein AB7O52_07880 [Planctomycetota bacterium]
MISSLVRTPDREPSSQRSHLRFVLTATVVAAFVVQSLPSGTGQTVGSGGVSQPLRISDEIDLRAFRNVLLSARPFLVGTFANNVPVTSMQFTGALAGQGSRLYDGGFTLQPASAGPLINRLEFVYRYVGVTALPTIPPDRVKFSSTPVVPTFPPPAPVIPTLETLDFIAAILGNPPAELLSFLVGRDLVSVVAYSPPTGSQEITVEFEYDGGPQQLPVTVVVAGSCTGGNCTWTATVL